jgi:hypothetical protein
MAGQELQTGMKRILTWFAGRQAEQAAQPPLTLNPHESGKTFNIQHSTPKVEGWREAERLGRSKLGVEG